MAEVQRVTSRRMKSRRGTILEVLVGDGRRTLTLIYFNQAWREKELVVGRRGLFAGKITTFQRGRQLAHPSTPGWTPAAGPNAVDDYIEAPVPIYPLVGAVKPWVVTNAVGLALDHLDPLDDPLPPELRERRKLIGLNKALRDIHTPANWAAVWGAQKRLKWDEALVLQITLAQRRRLQAADPATPRAGRPDGLLAAFDARLPFELTAGQREVGEQVAADLARAHPMHLLLQGEVGSGKTVVALRGMLQVIDAGGQAALLAPPRCSPRSTPQPARAARPARPPRRAGLFLLGAGVPPDSGAGVPPDSGAGVPPGPDAGGTEHATRVTLLTGSLPPPRAAGRCWRRRPARPASWWARMR